MIPLFVRLFVSNPHPVEALLYKFIFPKKPNKQQMTKMMMIMNTIALKIASY